MRVHIIWLSESLLLYTLTCRCSLHPLDLIKVVFELELFFYRSALVTNYFTRLLKRSYHFYMKCCETGTKWNFLPWTYQNWAWRRCAFTCWTLSQCSTVNCHFLNNYAFTWQYAVCANQHSWWRVWARLKAVKMFVLGRLLRQELGSWQDRPVSILCHPGGKQSYLCKPCGNLSLALLSVAFLYVIIYFGK